MVGLFKVNKKNHFRTRSRSGVDEAGGLIEKKSAYSKFGSKAQSYLGVDFDSALEVNIYKHLLLFKETKVIKDVEPHPKAFELIPAQYVDDKFHELKSGKNKNKGKICLYQSVCYNADFRITLNNGKDIYIDTKSLATVTDSFVIKQKLFFKVHGHALCIILKDMIPFLTHLIKDLEDGRTIDPVTKKQLAKLLDRYKGIK